MQLIALVTVLGFVVSLNLSGPASAEIVVPDVYTNIVVGTDGQLAVNGPGSRSYPAKNPPPAFSLEMVRGDKRGTDDGFIFSFVDSERDLKVAGGTLFFALIDLRHRFPLPKYRYSTPIDEDGRARVVMNGTLNGREDFTDWARRGGGHLFYRVQSKQGDLIYEGIFAFTAASRTGPYQVVQDSIVEGPIVEKMTHQSATVTFETLSPAAAQVEVVGVGTFDSNTASRHEVNLSGLTPDTEYDYVVRTTGDSVRFSFRTAPQPGSRAPFTFAYGSDSRAGIASGERDNNTVNEYMMRRVMPIATSRDAAFLMFTGDMVNGYNTSPVQQDLQYLNWRRVVWPFAARLPLYVGVGNHEVVLYNFDDESALGLEIPRFPFATDSPEATFRRQFANFENGPQSEDNSAIDPDLNAVNFPTYKETVFDYVWGNIAFVVLNSDYLYSPYLTTTGDPLVGGNIHGYIMDNQLAWLGERLAAHQSDTNIDHIFVTVHTPMFPNGGHISSDMFYNGDNSHRPVMAGKKAAQGIIQRRDAILRLILAHDKVNVVLAGDEHNYSRVVVDEGMPLYAENGYRPDDPVTITRPFHHVTNGASGAPYYGREAAPWHVGYSDETGIGDYLKKFTTQFAITLVHVDGKRLTLETVDIETLEVIDLVEID